MILNGWYRIHSGNASFSDKIFPLLTSIHINNPSEVKQETIDYLKKHEPIGCRDHSTERFLRARGVDAYFSACLTLTLGKSYKNISYKNDNAPIIFCDYEFGKYPEIDKVIKSLKNYNFSDAVNTTSVIDSTNLNDTELLKIAHELLGKYSKARLVVTSRIHCALPCLAMGTPVIFVKSHYDKRFDGITELLNYVGKGKDGFFVSRIKLDEGECVINDDSFKFYAEKLLVSINDFLQVSKEY